MGPWDITGPAAFINGWVAVMGAIMFFGFLWYVLSFGPWSDTDV